MPRSTEPPKPRVSIARLAWAYHQAAQQDTATVHCGEGCACVAQCGDAYEAVGKKKPAKRRAPATKKTATKARKAKRK